MGSVSLNGGKMKAPADGDTLGFAVALKLIKVINGFRELQFVVGTLPSAIIPTF